MRRFRCGGSGKKMRPLTGTVRGYLRTANDGAGYCTTIFCRAVPLADCTSSTYRPAGGRPRPVPAPSSWCCRARRTVAERLLVRCYGPPGARSDAVAELGTAVRPACRATSAQLVSSVPLKRLAPVTGELGLKLAEQPTVGLTNFVMKWSCVFPSPIQVSPLSPVGGPKN